MRFNPMNLSGMKDSSAPRNAGELCEYVHGVNGIPSSIPRFTERISPLRQLLEVAYAKANGIRKKKSIGKFALSILGWNDTHDQAFQDLQNQIQEATSMSHRDTNMVLCISTAASDKHWAVAATQCAQSELDMTVTDQSHMPLDFLSGSFTEREEHWSTYEREAFAIVEAFRRLDYLLTCDMTTRVFTDHRNLLFAFNPIAMEPSLGRHKVLKVVLWALFLSAFTYRIKHVPADANTWPDIMTRWMRGYRKTPAIRRISPSIPFSGVTRSPDSSDFDWPSLSEIIAAQQEHRDSAPNNSLLDEDRTMQFQGATWIPTDCIDLKLRLLTIAHAGNAGHRGVDPNWNSLRTVFSWTDERDDVCAFLSSCLLCVLSKSGNKIPRPMYSTLHATKPNEIIHFDYLYLGDGSDELNYALVVKDDLRGYCWLEPTLYADANHTAKELARWARTFTTPKVWVSDQGSHFKNEVVQHFAESYGIKHNFSVAYSPWVNGTVDALMRSVLSATRSMIGELKLAPQDWPSVLPAISTTLKEASLARLGRRPEGIPRSPLEVMTGIEPNRPVLRILPNNAERISAKTIDHARALQFIKIDELQTTLDNMHKDTTDAISASRDRAIEAHNKATNIIAPSFAIGDFVLVRRAVDRGHKLKFRWFGPCRITPVHGSLVYGVTPLQGGKSARVHCARLLKNRDSLLGTTVPDDMLELAERSESRYEIIEKIIDVGTADDGFFFQVKWDGLPDERDYTWQPITELFTDVPDMVIDLLSSFKKKKKTVVLVKRQLGIPV